MSDTVSGQCLCGAVCVTASPKQKHVEACHCSMCRQWGGAPAMVIDIDVAQPVTFSDETAVGVYASSQWAERGFCKTCGTHLFWRMRDGSFYTLPAGLFGDLADYAFAMEIYVDEKPANYSFAGTRKMMTAAEVEALFAGDS